VTFPPFLQRLLFAPIAATGFGMMRAAWGAVAFITFLAQWSDVAFFYSADGVLPPAIAADALRDAYRFSLLTWVTDPSAVFALYLILLAALLCATVGFRPRLSTIIATVLLFSFHERNVFVLGGGDTVLRAMGFLLCVSPELRAFSIARIPAAWRYFDTRLALPPPLMMSAWPQRLLLWQLIVLYGTSLWHKLLGTMWLNGTAVASALHHPMFARFSKPWMDEFAPLSSTICISVLLFHAGWLLLLIPRETATLLPRWVPRFPLKRTLLLGGVLFHGAIAVMMDAGSFAPAILAAYLGCVGQDDIDVLRASIRRIFFGQSPGRIDLFTDGGCGLCLRATFTLTLLDLLRRLHLVNIRDTKQREAHAKGLKLADLDRAMHIRFPGGRTVKGFDAFRAVAWHLPPLWPIAPLLYIPGVAPIGRRIYARVAANRKRCSHEGCNVG
jgi:predicted DCC family thiol-disulfide oxidoreductase YuxK